MKNYVLLLRILTKTFITPSLAIIFYPQILNAAEPINNTTEADKQVNIGDSKNPNDSIKGNISTSGNKISTTVTFANNASMQDGSITANNSGKNTINLQDKSFLNISEITANNGNNIISDSRDADAPKSFISGNINASSNGKNTLNNLKNFTLKGNIIAQGSGSLNTISLENASSIAGYISSSTGGVNAITLNGNSALQINNTTDSASIFASGNGSSNTISSNTNGGGGSIAGWVIAKDSGSNAITLDTLVINGDIKASGSGKNTITLNSSGSLKNLIVEDNGTNTITLNGNASILGYISSNTRGNNTITLNENAFLKLTNQGTDTNTAIYNSNSTNTITGSGNENHQITGDIIASDNGANTITLNNISLKGNIDSSSSATNTITLKTLNMTGNISADNASNTIKIGEDISSQTSSIKGDITAQNTSSKNTLEFYLTHVTGNITATSSGNNGIKLYGGGVNGKILATASGINDITLGNDTKQVVITGSIVSDNSGSNKITLKNATISEDIIANANGINTITITSTEDSNSVSNIVANSDGKNTITFEGSTLKGNILANVGGNNAISDNTSSSKLIGSLIADSGTNELTAFNLEITQKILAQNSGKNEIKAINTLLKSNSIEAQNGNNTINVTGGVLESTLIQAKGEDSSINTINLSNTSHLDITNTDVVILASDSANAKNTITDSTSGGVNNKITGNISALDSGINEITIKNITINGDVIAKNQGQNTINFGNTTPTSSVNSNIVADTATNILTFNNLNFIGSMQALSDSSTNTLNFKIGSFEGYLVVIGDNIESKNDLTLDNVTIHLKGTQVKNKDNQDIGTGNDAIYTQGKNAKNIINDKTSNTWKIEGNITSVNGGKNTYNFTNKVEMTGSLSASLSDASNDITLHIDSFIKEGYIKAKGDEVSNKITTNANAKLENLYLEAISQTNSAKNEIILNETSTMILIANQETQNAIFTQNTQASNNISGETTSKNTIAGDILAQAGSNTIALKSLDIIGDILTQNEGNNLIDIKGNNTENNEITGDIKALTGSNTLNLAKTTLSATTIIADGKAAKNTISFNQDSSFTINNSDATYALFANKMGAENIITQILDENNSQTGETTGTISGNIIAQEGGLNTITQIKNLTIQNGYIQAEGRESKNDIQIEDISLNLIASNTNDAISVNGNAASNILTTRNLNSANQNTITGNIYSNNGGNNIILLNHLVLSGNIIANKSGSNEITLGDMNIATTSQNSSIQGSIFASEIAAKNTITLYAPTQVALEKSTQGNIALLAHGKNAKNTITGKTTDFSSINADIIAMQGGENNLVLDFMNITGNIIASDNGKNAFDFTNSSNLKLQTIEANGTGSINTLASQAVSILSGLLSAKNGGQNDIRVTLKNPITKPLVDITTEAFSKNTLIVQGTLNAQSQITYHGGNTIVIFSESVDIHNNTNMTIDSENYKDGIMFALDSNKANEILRDFRKNLFFKENKTLVNMEDKNTLLISGIYVGKIDFLKTKTSDTQPQNLNPIKISLQENSTLISRINTNGNGNINLNLKQGSKWIATPNNASRIQVNSISTDSSVGINIDEASISTLAQNNTIVDIATGGYASKYTVTKDNFTNLVIADALSLDGVIFRFYADPINNKSDTITISNVSDTSKATTKAILQAYYTKESLENASKYNQKVLVATVESSAKDNFAFDVSEPTTVEQGYITITTEFEKKREKKNASSNQEVDNYYIKSYNKSLTSEATQNSYSILGINYLVFLANTNNINKRLGEKRNEDYSDSFWIRSYGGQITQNIGMQVTNNYISTQGGYDFGFGSQESMHFIGIALSYGLNFINSSLWKMQSQILSGAMYYSYIRNSGIYTDTIFKYDIIDTTPKAQDLNSNIKNNAFSLTQEIGYRLFLDSSQKLFLDFQMECIAGYLTDLKILQKIQNEQLLSQVNNFLVFRGRVGGMFAYRLKTSGTQTDFRVGTSYIGDYSMANFNLDSNGATSSMNMPYNQMISVNIGINSYITKKLRFYLEGEMGFMGKIINQNYAANLGLRYSFGTTKKEDIDPNIQQKKKIANELKTINIEASRIKCNGCNPESGFYLEITTLPSANTTLNNYLSRFSYRIYTQSNGVTYYFGPYKTIQDAKGQQDLANKIKQSLTKNPSAFAEIYKINNKAKN